MPPAGRAAVTAARMARVTPSARAAWARSDPPAAPGWRASSVWMDTAVTTPTPAGAVARVATAPRRASSTPAPGPAARSGPGAAAAVGPAAAAVLRARWSAVAVAVGAAWWRPRPWRRPLLGSA